MLFSSLQKSFLWRKIFFVSEFVTKGLICDEINFLSRVIFWWWNISSHSDRSVTYWSIDDFVTKCEVFWRQIYVVMLTDWSMIINRSINHELAHGFDKRLIGKRNRWKLWSNDRSVMYTDRSISVTIIFLNPRSIVNLVIDRECSEWESVTSERASDRSFND